MPDKSALLNAAKNAYQQQRDFIAQLSDAERAEVGSMQRWSPKDMLAHTAVWTQRRLDDFEALARGDSPAEYQDDDHENEAIFSTYRDLSWDEVERMIEDAHTRAMAFMQALPEGELLSTEHSPFEDRPLWRGLAGNRVLHVMYHLIDYHIDRGNHAQARALIDQTYAFGLLLDDSRGWKGSLLYDRACVNAATGQPDAAVDHLREALQLNPALVEASKTDSDLDPLRDRADFQALYE